MGTKLGFRKGLAIFTVVALALLFLAPLANGGIFGDKDKSKEKKEEERAEVRKMRDEVLAGLYKEKPELRSRIKRAAGYGVFKNLGVHVLLLSTASGHGLVVDNTTRKETFMKMGSVGAGVGLGVKDFRAVFIFYDRQVLKTFVEEGWDFGGQADAAAEAGKQGGSGEAAESVQEGIEIYQITKNGIALQATIQGTKYWKDDDFN